MRYRGHHLEEELSIDLEFDCGTMRFRQTGKRQTLGAQATIEGCHA